MTKRAQRKPVLAHITRSEWLLRMLVLAAGACVRRGDHDRARRTAMTIAYWGGHHALSPYEDESAKFLMFLPLVTADVRGNLEGRLAERWEHSADYREWTYYLRPGVKWHDGTPVTAHDIEFTASLFRGHRNWFPPGTTVTAIDDSTVRIRSSTGNPGEDAEWIVYYPRHLLKDLDPDLWSDWEFWRHPIGNGPYRFVRYVPETMTELEANPDYFGGKPRIERVVLKFGGRAVTELLSGQVDIIPETDPALWLTLRSDERFRIYYHSALARWAVYWRNDHPLFRDVRVRRALTLAINRRELLGIVNYPPTTPVIDGPYTSRQLQRGNLPEPLPYDPAQARALLDAAGWRDRGGNGTRQRDGRPFRFTALASRGPSAVYVQNQLQRVGVRMELQPAETAVILEAIKRGRFEAAVSLFLPTASRIEEFFGPGAPTGYENPALIELLRRWKATADPDALDRIHGEIVDIFRRDLPVTFLFPSLLTSFAHRRIRGWNRPWAELFAKPEDLWIEE